MSSVKPQTSENDPRYVALLGLAEKFRTAKPANIRLAIHCLQSIFAAQPPPRVAARTHLQIGKLLLQFSTEVSSAKEHLDKCHNICESARLPYEDLRFECADLYSTVCRKDCVPETAIPVVAAAVEQSQKSPYWHCRLLFQTGQLYCDVKNYGFAVEYINRGINFCTKERTKYTKVLFLLSKAMILLIERNNLDEAAEILSTTTPILDSWIGTSTLTESLRVFELVLKVSRHLMLGQVKEVKNPLKQLQQTIQTISSLPEEDDKPSNKAVEQFHWLPKEQLCVLVYLVTVMHSMQAGFMDKAQKYTEKALMQIEKLRSVDSHPILCTFQVMLLEHVIMCRLIMGKKTEALGEVAQMASLLSANHRLQWLHGAQLHTLLGLYAMSMNCMDSAELQFRRAIQLREEGCSELDSFIHLNLAIVYMRAGRHQDLEDLNASIDPKTINSKSFAMKAAAYYVQGLRSFFQEHYPEAKRFLRETLKMSNTEDLNRLTSCSLVLLGHIFMSTGNTKESQNMVTPAMQLAHKIPDINVQLWATALLRDLYNIFGDSGKAQEAYQSHTAYSQQLLKDHFSASQRPEHSLINWTQGQLPSTFNQNS